MDENQLHLEDINQAWSKLLSRYVITTLSLEKQDEELRIELVKMKAENEELQKRLKQAELNILAAQGKSIIDG